MKYKIAVFETYKEIVEVDANDEDEALSAVWSKYQNEETLDGEVSLEEVKVELA